MNRDQLSLRILLPLAALLLAAAPAHADKSRTRIRFNRDIRPILSDKCFQCHGPDAGARKAELRLDDPQSVLRQAEVIKPGDPDHSDLFRRITSQDDAERMPPPGAARSLTTAETELLRQWIQEGAEFEAHWAFVPPERPRLPTVTHPDWPRNAIDWFILHRMEREGLTPSREADRRSLIRRVTLDLTGLPPTPEEVADFLSDSTPQAYETLVDRLLASPRYGERMTADWLDAARFADTHGYLFDTQRSMWRWRDWVIQSFNQNQPFDQFTIEQLAGDLLSQPTFEQRMATGFNRNHIINNEAGATPEEYYVENILDRVNTTAAVWMGLTTTCAQCHDHKYDPLTQREFYQLYAFFNNVPELGLDGFNANAQPLMKAPTDEQKLQISELDRQLAGAETTFAPLQNAFGPAQQKWEQEFARIEQPVEDGLLTWLPFERKQGDPPPIASPNPVFRDGEPVHEPGLFGDSISLDGQRFVELGNVAKFTASSPFTLSAWIYPTSIKGRRSLFSRMEEPEVSFRGYALQVVEGQLALFLVHSFPEDLLQVQAKLAIEPHQWHHVLATYDGSGKVAGVKLYINGKLQEVGISIDKLAGAIETEKPLLVGNGHPLAKFIGRIDEVRIYNRVLTEEEVSRVRGVSIHSHLAVEPASRTEEQNDRIRKYYLNNAAPPEWREPYQRIVELRQRKKEFDRTLPTVMVMEELPQPRETEILVRGLYNQPGEKVSAATPAFLPPMREDLPKNRLGFARWLTDPRHPLTSRVIVNRYWQMHFGEGLVRTSENFGIQGEWPTHPDLLDWLATELVRNEWNLKALHRLIVTSATYRQSAQVTDRLREVDPQNRFLARGPRVRLTAETIRDHALFSSGLLVDEPGGPSVKPYEPEALWREVAFDTTGQALTAQLYVQDHGKSLYRRSMYTFWKRTSPPATMLLFDGPDRERCIVRRERTNTPLQALVLMNDPTYVEASRKLAERMLHEAENSPAARISRGFLLTLSREPAPTELAPLQSLLDQQLERFSKDPQAADQFLKIGESARDESLPAAKLAAYSVIANVLLNLDETVTKGR